MRKGDFPLRLAPLNNPILGLSLLVNSCFEATQTMFGLTRKGGGQVLTGSAAFIICILYNKDIPRLVMMDIFIVQDANDEGCCFRMVNSLLYP